MRAGGSDESHPLESAVAAARCCAQDEGGVATLTLNRPAQFNAINGAMLTRAAGRRSTRSPTDASVRVVVIAGAGRAFCRRPRLEGDARELAPRRSSATCSARCCDVMLTMQRAAAAGDRARPRHRDGRRLPDRRRLRPRGAPTKARGSRRRASTSGCSARRPACRCRATSRASARSRCCSPASSSMPQTALDWGLVNRVVPADGSTPRSPRSPGR